MNKEMQKIIAYESLLKTLVAGIEDGSITDLLAISGAIKDTLEKNKGE